VRLRFINAASMSIYDVRIPGLKMTVVQADGQDVQPSKWMSFASARRRTYDVIVQPTDDRAYTIFAERTIARIHPRDSRPTCWYERRGSPCAGRARSALMDDMGMIQQGMEKGGMNMPGMDNPE